MKLLLTLGHHHLSSLFCQNFLAADWQEESQRQRVSAEGHQNIHCIGEMVVCVTLSDCPLSFSNNILTSLAIFCVRMKTFDNNWGLAAMMSPSKKITRETLMTSKYNLPVLNLFHVFRNSSWHYVGKELRKPVLSSQSLEGLCFINLSSLIELSVSFVLFWDRKSWLEEAPRSQLAWRLFSLIRQKGMIVLTSST